MKSPEMYFSFDVECDGPYPAHYSMLSIGMVACATFDGTNFERLNTDDEDLQFYSTINPITKNYNEDAVEICRIGGVDRRELVLHSDPYLNPVRVIARLEEFVRGVCNKHDNVRPVAIAYPLSFDWMWLYWYECKFGEGRKGPFGFSGCMDIKSLYAARRRTTIGNSTKKQMPKKLHSTRPHTHNALDDALEQADLFCNIWELKNVDDA